MDWHIITFHSNLSQTFYFLKVGYCLGNLSLKVPKSMKQFKKMIERSFQSASNWRISKQHWQDSSGEWSIESWREESMEKSLLCVSQLEICSVLLVNFVFEGNWNRWLCSVLTSSNMTPCCVVQVNNKYALSTIVHLESFAAVFNTVPQKRTLHYHPKTKIIFKTKTR